MGVLRSSRFAGFSEMEVGTVAAPVPETPRHVDPAEQFVAAARGGDRRASQSLLSALLPRVRNLVRYLVRNDDDTDDITQEALLAILRGLGGFRADGSLKSWVDRVVVRVTFAFIRKRRREPATAPSRMQLVDLPRLEISDVTAMPGDYLARRRAIAVLDQVPLEQRHALVLHHVLEMSVPEIAAQLVVSAETVRSRLRLARTRLRSKGMNIDAGDDDVVSSDDLGGEGK